MKWKQYNTKRSISNLKVKANMRYEKDPKRSEKIVHKQTQKRRLRSKRGGKKTEKYFAVNIIAPHFLIASKLFSNATKKSCIVERM